MRNTTSQLELETMDKKRKKAMVASKLSGVDVWSSFRADAE
jgi:hypothetical protein